MENSNEIFRALGMTIIHSLWQGIIIITVVGFLLALIKRSNARVRYMVLFSGLILLLTGFVVTFIFVFRDIHLAGEQTMDIYRQQTGIANIFPLTPLSMSERIFELLEPFFPSIAGIWLAGFLLMSIRTGGGYFYAYISFRKGLSQPDEKLRKLFDSLRSGMNLPSSVKLRISSKNISPLVTGIISPMVIIPVAAISGLGIDQIRAVLIHELAHIRRLDHLFILIEAIARPVLFFHPVAWFLLPLINSERENCCDDYVLKSDNNSIIYIKALAMIQEMNLQDAPANAITGGKSKQLLNRIKRLINPELKQTPLIRVSVILFFMAVVGISTMAFIVNGQPDVKKAGPAFVSDAEIMQNIDQDGDKTKKKITVIFEGDSIREMTVNGKKISKEDMKNYAGEINKMQQQLELQQEDLERAQQELADAREELESSREYQSEAFQQQMLKARHDAMKAFESARLKHDEYVNSEQFREEMKKAGEEAMKAFEAQKKAYGEYMNSEKFREQMQKARDEAQKAFEEMKKQGNYNFNFQYDFETPITVPPMPPFPPAEDVDADVDIDLNAIPHVESIPEIPEVPDVELSPDSEPDTHSDIPAKSDESKRKMLDSQLRELEE